MKSHDFQCCEHNNHIFYLGIATAAGCQLVATCDLAVATHKSTFAVPG